MEIQVNWRSHPMPNNRVIGGMIECHACGLLFPCEFPYGKGEKISLNEKGCTDENKRKGREKEQEEVLLVH